MNPFQPFRLFYGMRIPHLALLMRCASEATYKAGDILFRKGESTYRLYLIKSGSIALEAENPNGTGGTKMARSGDVLGRSLLASPATWPVTARAVEPTKVIVLWVNHLLACAEENPDFGIELMRRTAERRVEDLEPHAEELALNPVDPMTRSHHQFHAGTINTGNSGFAPFDTLDIAEAGAKHLSLRDGEWVQLTARHGTAIFPVRIKHETKDGAGVSGESAPESPMEGVVSLIRS